MKLMAVISAALPAACFCAIPAFRSKAASKACTGVGVRVKETSAYVFFSIFLWLEAALLIWKISGTDFASYPPAFQQNIVVFLAASILLGAYTFLNCVVKVIYLYEDKMVYINIIGSIKEIPWSAVKRVQVLPPQRVRLFYGEDESIAVSGGRKGFKIFLKYALRYTPEQVDKRQLIDLGKRYHL